MIPTSSPARVGTCCLPLFRFDFPASSDGQRVISERILFRASSHESLRFIRTFDASRRSPRSGVLPGTRPPSAGSGSGSGRDPRPLQRDGRVTVAGLAEDPGPLSTVLQPSTL